MTDVCEECFLKVTQEPQKELADMICNSAKTLERLVRPLSRLKSKPRPDTSSTQRTVRLPPKRRSNLNLSLDQDKIDENLAIQPQNELVKLISKARPKSGSRNSCDTTVLHSSASRSSSSSNIPGFLAAKRAALSNRKGGQNLDSSSKNQNSSPARIRHLDLSDPHASLLDEKTPASLSVIQENHIAIPPPRNSSKLFKGSLLIPTERSGSVNQIRNKRISMSKRSIASKPPRDFEDFIRPSIEDLSTTVEPNKFQTDNHSSDATSLRERYC